MVRCTRYCCFRSESQVMASATPFSTAGAEPTSEMPTDEPAHFDEERVPILDLAEEIGVRQQWLFKVARRLSIRHIKRREPARGNQLIATVTPAEAATIRSEVARSRAERRSDDCLDAEAAQSPYVAEEVGVFYIIQLEPQFDPGRFKLGWAGDIEERLRKHRCVAPFAICVKKWPCRRAW